MQADLTAIFVIGSMCLCAVLIVAASLYYHYKKEQMKSKERLTAIEKGIAPKELLTNGDGACYKSYSSRKEAEIFGGIKLLIIGFFLALALWITTGKGDHQFDVAVWGLFISGIGLAKIVVGMLLKKPSEEN